MIKTGALVITILFSILIEKLSYSKYLIGLVWEDYP